MNKRRSLIIITVVVAVIAAIVYFYFDPSSSRLFPRCLFLETTGVKCPGCGSQRAIHALLHGNVAAAWQFNAMVVIAIPLIAFYVVVSVLKDRWPRLYRVLFSRTVLFSLVGLIVLWWVVRNVADW